MALIPSPQDILSRVQSLFPSLPQGNKEPALATPAPAIPSNQTILARAAPAIPPPSSLPKIAPPSPFSETIGKTAGEFAENAFSGAKDFVIDNARNVTDALTGKLGITPADLLYGVKKTASGIDWLAKGLNEGVFRMLKSGIQTVSPTIAKGIGDVTLFGEFGKAATGQDSIPTYQDIYPKLIQYATDNKATPKEAASFASLGILGLALGDNPLLGPGESGFKLSAKAIEDLAKATDEKAVIDILRAENPNITDTQATVLAPVFRDAKTPEQVQKGVNLLRALKPSPMKSGYLSRPTETKTISPDDLYRQVTGVEPPKRPGTTLFVGDEARQAAAREGKVIPEGPTVREEPRAPLVEGKGGTTLTLDSSKEIPEELKPLAEQAKKYGSAEEFISDQKPVFRSTEKPFDKSLLKREGLFVSDSRNIAEFFGNGRNLIDELYISPNARVLEWENLPENLREEFSHEDVDLESVQGDVADYARKNGFDVVDSEPQPGAFAGAKTERQIVNPDVVLTKQQLTDLYDRATAKEAEVPVSRETAGKGENMIPEKGNASEPGFDRGLVRKIANEKAPGPIADMLAKEYPRLPQSVVNSAAGRLRTMNRTSDIEGMMHSLATIQESIQKKTGLFGKDGATIPKPGQRGGSFRSVADVMKPAQKEAYLRTITESLRDRESAVLAQQEYQALWESANQDVIDLYNTKTLERDFLKDSINENPAAQIYNDIYKPFGRTPSDSAYELQELWERGQPQERGLSGIPRNKLARLDQTIEEAGFKDFADAQEALEKHEEQLRLLKQYDEELKYLKVQVRQARMLQDFIDDVPVVAREKAGSIDTIANPDWIRNIYKDISGFTGQINDVYRIFEKVFGKKYGIVKHAILDPFDRAKGAMIDELVKLGDELEEGVTKKFGIKRGSKESAAIQRYGDTGLEGGERLTEDNLVRQFGREKANNIIAADAWFRDTYDRLIDEINAVRERIYPNNPNKIIPKRPDYYRHFRELGTSFKDLLNIFETPSGIDPKLAGLSEWTKPQSKFLSFAQERLGKRTDIDAVGGFLDYANYFAYAKHIDPHIGIFRYLRKKLSEVSPTPGVGEMTEAGLVKHEGLNNFLSFLDKYANDLAGKTNPADRYVQDGIPGGRATMKAINWLNHRAKANTILGNLSSAVAQIFNVPQGIASAKLYSIPGIQRTLASIFTENEPMAASSFIKERYKEDLGNRFRIDWVEHPLKGSTERATELAAWLTQALDEVGTKFIWNSHYAKGVAEGVEDLVKYADDMTRKMVAGRGIGEVPLVQKSKLMQLVFPFQLEVQNLWHVMRDFVDAKDFGALATLFVANYLMNRAAEKVRGSPVVFDPINATIDGLTQAADEMRDGGGLGRASAKFFGREMGEVLSNVYGGQTLAAALPDTLINKATGGVVKDKKDFFGTADPGRFGSAPILISSLDDALYKLIPPFGGVQAKKTIGAVQSMLSGEVKTSSGALSFKTPTDPASVVQAFLFGKNATAEAQKAYAENDDLYQRTYRQDIARSQLSLNAEKAWADIKNLKKSGDGAGAAQKLKDIAKSNPQMAQKIVDIAKQEKLGLTSTDRLIKMLGVENGERAKYIADSVRKMPKEERAMYLKDLAAKKLLTKQVIAQIANLIGANHSDGK